MPNNDDYSLHVVSVHMKVVMVQLPTTNIRRGSLEPIWLQMATCIR